MAFQIIRHAFAIIFNNFGQALRVSIVPFAVLVAAFLTLSYALGLEDQFQRLVMTGGKIPQGDSLQVIGGIGLFVVFMFVLGLFVFAWVAVSWHRFILMEEYAGWLPSLSGKPIWAYAGRSIVYVLLLLLIAIPIMLVAGMLVMPLLGVGPQSGGRAISVAGFVVTILANAALTYFWFRIALALPSVAIGKPISVRDAFGYSSNASGAIFGLALILMAIGGVGGVLVTQLNSIAPLVGVVFDVFVQWLTLMLGVSILTTLYGHLVEKRPLAD